MIFFFFSEFKNIFEHPFQTILRGIFYFKKKKPKLIKKIEKNIFQQEKFQKNVIFPKKKHFSEIKKN